MALIDFYDSVDFLKMQNSNFNTTIVISFSPQPNGDKIFFDR